MVLDNKDIERVVYSSGEFEFSDVELKSSKKLRLTGFISTSKRDSNGDIVTENAQEGLVSQIKERIASGKHITMDFDHESFRKKDGKMHDRIQDKIPVAKIDDAHLVREGDVTKTKVDVEVNQDHPLYESIKKSIMNGYLHSFSIAYKVKEGFNTMVDGVKTRILEDLILRNVGITGVPVNDDSDFEVSLKSYIKKMEQEEQIKNLTESMAELKSQVESFAKVEEKLTAESTELKSKLEEKDSVIAELKSAQEKTESVITSKIEDLKVSELQESLKSQSEKVEALENTLTELKSKGFNKAAPRESTENTQDVNVFALM